MYLGKYIQTEGWKDVLNSYLEKGTGEKFEGDE